MAKSKSVEKETARRWEPVEAHLHVWCGEHEPTAIEGIWRGFKPGKYADHPNMRIEIGNEVQTWTCPTILRSKLETLPIGMPVRIEHRGSLTLKSGQMAHNFEVMFDANYNQERLPFDE